jgi:hypothetical protein
MGGMIGMRSGRLALCAALLGVLTLSGCGTSAHAPAPRTPAAAPVAAAPPAQPAAPAVAFTDIAGLAAEDAITNEAALGIFDTTTGPFKPTDSITRAEFVRWLVRANNAYYKDTPAQQIKPADTGAATFVDVPPAHPDFKYIQGMANAGFVIGVDKTHFAPDRAITREEMLAIKIARDNKGPSAGDPNGLGYTDKMKVNPNYAAAVGSAGSVFSTQDVARVWGSIKTLNPQKPVTRGEAAICLARFGWTGVTPFADAATAAGRSSAPAGAAAPAQPAAATVAFTDIAGTTAEQTIKDEAALGVFDATTGAFKPAAPITRAEFVRWLVRANNAYYKDPTQQIRPAETTDATFVDVPPAHPDFKYIQGMANAGFVIGVDQTHFAPDRPISREEMLAIKIGRDYRGSAAGDPRGLPYTDKMKVSPTYAGAVGGAASVFSTRDIGRVWGSIKTLNPQKPVTRGEAALCLARFGWTGVTPFADAAKAAGRTP